MAPLLTSLVDPTLDNTIGAAYLGVVGAGFLFGITTLQLYRYFHSYSHDPLFQKAAVAILWILDAFHLFLTIHGVYRYVITGFGSLLGLQFIQWSIQLQVLVNVIVIVMVHSLYAKRLWKRYHQGVLGYISQVSIVIAGFGASRSKPTIIHSQLTSPFSTLPGIGLFLAYKVFTVKRFIELDSIAWAITAALGTSTAIDFFIAAAMCWYLHKSRGAGARLNSRIALVMQYSLNTGLLTSACSLTAMFTYILMPNTFVFLGLEFMLTKFYVGSFLAMLNSREKKLPQKSFPDESIDLNSLMKKSPITSSTGQWGLAPLTAHLSFPPPSHTTNSRESCV
ncbi:hypothetical protein EST38_g3567 [Candolleomyces aberdarensis]|uniref:DUF6534 domain-containing protein n=1 Tax=Candolleomyces aberdarensis TaxID=2316362 RepID=A0A4Q2DQ80_9AGAR|nr:hypothetical protein EST38_g3567 [Candolleomyces aberdarensis]